MKVLLVNGSPHKNGCTYTALCEVSSALNENGISTDIFWIGNKPISGCIACRKCQEKNKCILDDIVNEFLEIAGDYDGFVFGTPVHWGGAGGAITSFMDRVFYADLNGGGDRFRLKPAAVVISARRAGYGINLLATLRAHFYTGNSICLYRATCGAIHGFEES